MQRLGSYVHKTVRSLKAEQAIKLHQLKSAWLEAVGPFLGSQTEPVRVRYDVLYLVVSSPAWAQEVKLQQRLILQKLRSVMRYPPKKITCWVGEVHVARTLETAEDDDSEDLVPWKNVKLPEARRARIEETVATISEPKLQNSMRKLLTLSVQRELYLLEQGQLPCPACGNFRPPELAICRECQKEKREEADRRVMRLLAQKPWLTARDAAEQLPLRDRATFMRIRKSLLAGMMLSAWQRTTGLEGRDLIDTMSSDFRSLLLDITMLRCSLPAHSLQPRHFQAALGKRLADAYLAEP